MIYESIGDFGESSGEISCRTHSELPETLSELSSEIFQIFSELTITFIKFHLLGLNVYSALKCFMKFL